MGLLPTVCFGGHGRAGKDTAGKHLGRISLLKYVGSTSWWGTPVVAERLGICHQEAWETRHERRQEWYEILNDYRRDDATRLIRDSLAHGPIVVGVRDRNELFAARRAGLLTHVIWIYKPDVPVDPTVTYTAADCDLVIGNVGTIPEFEAKVEAWARKVGIPLKK